MKEKKQNVGTANVYTEWKLESNHCNNQRSKSTSKHVNDVTSKSAQNNMDHVNLQNKMCPNKMKERTVNLIAAVNMWEKNVVNSTKKHLQLVLVRGSTHQGSTQFCVSSRGKQCTCNAIISLCMSLQSQLMTRSNLDSILKLRYSRTCNNLNDFKKKDDFFTSKLIDREYTETEIMKITTEIKHRNQTQHKIPETTKKGKKLRT